VGNRVIFIGAGPGSPDLLTVAAVKAIEDSLYVLAPNLYRETFSDLLAGKEVESAFSMNHAALTDWIEARLTTGSVCLLMPGDFSIFCPFQSVVSHFKDRVEVIPGVGAHAAASAALKKTFDMPGVAHTTIHTSPRAFKRPDSSAGLKDFAKPGCTLIIYMNNLPLEQLTAELKAAYGQDMPIAILERLGCPDHKETLATLDTIVKAVGDRDPFNLNSPTSEPSLALIIVGEALAKDESPEWWDHRYENCWKAREMR